MTNSETATSLPHSTRGRGFLVTTGADPFAGPSRSSSPATAMARDFQDIVAARGGCDEADLLARGWSVEEIATHKAKAVRLDRARAL